jgi:hypothetical protein
LPSAPTTSTTGPLSFTSSTRCSPWASRKGLVRDADESNAPPELTPAEADHWHHLGEDI